MLQSLNCCSVATLLVFFSWWESAVFFVLFLCCVFCGAVWGSSFSLALSSANCCELAVAFFVCLLFSAYWTSWFSAPFWWFLLVSAVWSHQRVLRLSWLLSLSYMPATWSLELLAPSSKWWAHWAELRFASLCRVLQAFMSVGSTVIGLVSHL